VNRAQSPASNQAFWRLKSGAWVRTGIPILWIAALVLLWEPLGFVVSTALVLCAWLLSVRVRWTVAVPVGAVVAAIIFQLFAVTLGVPLPWGLLGW
jgi:hypothetical protein